MRERWEVKVNGRWVEGCRNGRLWVESERVNNQGREGEKVGGWVMGEYQRGGWVRERWVSLSSACWSSIKGHIFVDPPPPSITRAINAKSFSQSFYDTLVASFTYCLWLFHMPASDQPSLPLPSPTPSTLPPLPASLILFPHIPPTHLSPITITT